MAEIEKCSNTDCAKNYQVTEIGGKMPGTKESEEITCPYCNHTITRRSNGSFMTHTLPEDHQ